MREPLKPGREVSLANGGKYVIKKQIGEGGYSLIYQVTNQVSRTSLVLKEFFPACGAERNTEGLVVPDSQMESRKRAFRKNWDKFQMEGIAGGQAANVTFQTSSFLEQSGGYAVMRMMSEDMCSISELVRSWDQGMPLPGIGADPVYVDTVRIRYALQIVDSVLAALGAIHDSGYLHLDLSSSNVMWAGQDMESGNNCSAFIFDFGCALPMENGKAKVESGLSCSPGFSAPEMHRPNTCLTPSTDIYSVGMLLAYLCIGEDAFSDIIRHEKNHRGLIIYDTWALNVIEDEIIDLQISDTLKRDLSLVFSHSLCEQGSRYDTAAEMQTAVRKLRESIPRHPINSDCTREFTLYSLKSMLCGSQDPNYTWAHELMERRRLTNIEISDQIGNRLTTRRFRNDLEFLQAVLSKDIYDYLVGKMAEAPETTIQDIMTGRYPDDWKEQIVEELWNMGMNDFLRKSRDFPINVGYWENIQRLFDILADESSYSFLEDCYSRTYANDHRYTYIGLTMITVYALLGPTVFIDFIGEPENARRMFHAVEA